MVVISESLRAENALHSVFQSQTTLNASINCLQREQCKPA